MHTIDNTNTIRLLSYSHFWIDSSRCLSHFDIAVTTKLHWCILHSQQLIGGLSLFESAFIKYASTKYLCKTQHGHIVHDFLQQLYTKRCHVSYCFYTRIFWIRWIGLITKPPQLMVCEKVVARLSFLQNTRMSPVLLLPSFEFLAIHNINLTVCVNA